LPIIDLNKCFTKLCNFLELTNVEGTSEYALEGEELQEVA
jgi:hypothetical protein